MLKIIDNANTQRKTLSILIGKEQTFFYLPKRLAVLFMPFLTKGILVDFEVGEKQKKIGKVIYQEIAYFRKIEDRQSKKIFFDLETMRDKMFVALTKYDNLLFMDFEMTLADYKQKFHHPHIIQWGAYLTTKTGKLIKKFNYYIYPKNKSQLNQYTLDFLSLDPTKFLKEAISFSEFYGIIKQVITDYNPHILVWGINDHKVLESNSRYYQLDHTIFKREMFSDLLKLYKNYFQVSNDIGLLKAYHDCVTVSQIPVQVHDALEDAYMTKEVYFAFYKELYNHFQSHDQLNVKGEHNETV